MFKKIIMFLLLFITTLSISCKTDENASESILKNTLAIPKGQTKEQYTEAINLLEYRFSANNIVPDKMKISTNENVEGMDENWIAYDVTDINGDEYVLIIRKNDLDLAAILDVDGAIVDGIIDSDVTPKLFKGNNM